MLAAARVANGGDVVDVDAEPEAGRVERVHPFILKCGLKRR
jgi:hypothetical protein